MTEAHEAWRAWRDERNSSLAESHGWLTLVAFSWVGSEPAAVERFPGLWCADELGVHAHFSEDEGVARDGELVAEYSVELSEDESVFELVSGSRLAEVGMRGGRYMVRVRDSESPILKGFRGVPVYEYDAEAVVSGYFQPYAEVVRQQISTANPAVPGVAELVGEVSFEFGSKEYVLKVQGGVDGLTAIFHDETNGQTTPGWRFVSFDAPVNDGERLVEGDVSIDFNRSLNFPSAFTAFGTCPMPPVGNELGQSVRAGEKRPS